jgi:hypothetical protein
MKDLWRFVATNDRRMLPVVMAIFFLTACQTMPVSFSGGMVPSSKQVPLVESGLRSGQYNTEDLRIDYEYSRSGNKLSISGSIYFADRIINSFLRIEQFHADLIFVDAGGRALEAQGLTSSSFSKSDGGLTFSRDVAIPVNAASLSFSYSGTAKSGHRDSGVGGGMYFSDYPAP